MKTKHNINLMALLMLSSITLFYSCSGNNASPDQGGSGITSNDEAIQNIPSPDPSSMDYSLVSPESSESVSRGLTRQGAPGPEEVGCLVDALYTTGTQFARQIERMMLCKARGAFALASEGSVDLTLNESGEVYLRFLAIAGEDNEIEPDEDDISRVTEDDMSIIAKITHTPGEGLGTYRLYACENDRQIGYAVFTVEDDTYSGQAILREGEMGECAQAVYTRNTASITNADFEGNITLNFNSTTEQGILALSADGATQSNTLQGKHLLTNENVVGVALGFWEATQGCGRGSFGDETTGDVAFSISVASDGGKTYSDYDGDSAVLCANLPSEPSLSSCQEFSEVAEAEWDCDVTGKTVVEFSNASELEDAGGERCRDLADAFENAESNPDACFE